MNSRFVIEVRTQQARLSSSVRVGGGTSSTGTVGSAAKQAEADAKKAEKAAISAEKAAQKAAASKEKAAAKAASAEIKEAQRSQREAEKGFNAMLRYHDKVAIAAERAAKRAGDARAREAKRAADAEIKEAARAQKAQEKALAALSTARRGSFMNIASQLKGQATSTGYGTFKAAGALAGGVQSAASRVSEGGITNVLSTVPRAAGDLLKAGGEAAAQFARGVGVGIAKALPNALGFVGRMVGNAFAVVGELAGALGSAAGEIAGFLGDKLGTALKVAVGGAVGVAVLGIKEALEREDLKPLFEKFAKKSGKSYEEALEQLRTASQGLIGDTELLTLANQEFLRGSVATTDQLAEMLKYADALGDATGGSATEGIQTLITAIGTLRDKGARQLLGSTISFEKAFKAAGDAAAEMGGTLEEEQKHAIAFGVVLEGLRQRFGDLPESVRSTADEFAAFRVNISNTLSAIGEGFLPALASVLKGLSPVIEAVGAFFTNNRAEIVSAIAGSFGDLSKNIGNLPEIIRNLKLEQVLRGARIQGEMFWIKFKGAAAATFDFLKNEIKALGTDLAAFAIEHAEILGFATGGIPGAAIGSGLRLGATIKAEQMYGAGTKPEDVLHKEASAQREAGRKEFGHKLKETDYADTVRLNELRSEWKELGADVGEQIVHAAAVAADKAGGVVAFGSTQGGGGGATWGGGPRDEGIAPVRELRSTFGGGGGASWGAPEGGPAGGSAGGITAQLVQAAAAGGAAGARGGGGGGGGGGVDARVQAAAARAASDRAAYSAAGGIPGMEGSMIAPRELERPMNRRQPFPATGGTPVIRMPTEAGGKASVLGSEYIEQAKELVGKLSAAGVMLTGSVLDVAQKIQDAANDEAFTAAREKLTAPIRKRIELEEKGYQDFVAAEKRRQDHLEERKKLDDDEAQKRKEIAANYDANVKEINAATAASIENIRASAVASKKSELEGGVGGFGPDESGIPTKLKRAAKKARREANRARKESLRNLTAGQSVDELAAGGGAGVKAALGQQAEIEATTGAGGAELAAATGQAELEAAQKIAALQEQRFEAERKASEDRTAEWEKFIATEEKAAALHDKEAEAAKEHNDRIKKLETELERISRALDQASK